MFGSETLMKLMVELGITGADKVKNGLNDVSKAATTTDANLTKVGGTSPTGTGGGSAWMTAAAFGGIAVGVAQIGRKLWDLAADAGELTSNLKNLSDQTGFTTGDLQEILYLLSAKDINPQVLEASIGTLTKKIIEAREPTKATAEILKTLNISLIDANGNYKTANQIFTELLPKLADMEDKTLRDKIAMELFGKTGKELLPILADGSKGIEEQKTKFQELGVTLDEEAIAKGDKFNNVLNDLGLQFLFIKTETGITLIPAFQSISDFISKNIIPAFDSLKIAVGILGTVMGMNFKGIAGTFKGSYDIIAGIMTLDWKQTLNGLKEFTLPLLESIRLAIEGLGTIFDTFWKNIKPKFIEFGNYVNDHLVKPISNFITKINEGIEKTKELLKIAESVPSDPGGGGGGPSPGDSKKPGSGGGFGDDKTKPKPPKPKPTPPNQPIPMATGGIVNSPTHILAGEAGPEAIVPLNNRILQNIGQNVSGFINMLGSTASSAYDYTEAGYQPLSQNNATVYGQGNIGGGQGSQLKSRAQMRLDAFNEGRIFVDSRDANELEKALNYMGKHMGEQGATGDVMTRLQGTLQRAGYPEDMAKYLAASAAQKTGYNVTINNYSPTPLSAQQITENFKAQMAVMGLNA
jgi:hypothetical protein